jgi:hypothetical protein
MESRMKVIGWIKGLLAKVIISLVQCVMVALIPWSTSAATRYNISSTTIEAYSVPYQMNIVIFEEMASNATLDVYVTTGACKNNTVGNSTLVLHNANHNNVQFNLPAFGTYCYYGQITEPGGAVETPELLTIQLQKEKPPSPIKAH